MEPNRQQGAEEAQGAERGGAPTPTGEMPCGGGKRYREYQISHVMFAEPDRGERGEQHDLPRPS